MDLIIVESPSKAKTITKYLNGKYKVDASGGHVRDLPEKTMGVRMDDFEPRYEIKASKKETIARLSAEVKKADKVYLATDPDREGEAISWHLQYTLGLNADEANRIEFNEISPRAVENALQHPRRINPNLVDAQQARRVLDRIVGYKLSPLLNKRLPSGSSSSLSAGRVQSVALKIIVDREREISAFRPEEYWNFVADLRTIGVGGGSFKATYLLKKVGRNILEDEAGELEKRLRGAVYKVEKIKNGMVKQHAPAPFTTSSLQQDASNKLGMSAPETMLIAQHLYEGMEVGGDHTAFVTYIRTDSTRVSVEAQRLAADFIKENYGAEYCPAKPNVYSTKKNIQDAHEAIRPINLEVTPASVKDLLDRKHYNVYKLIYDRFIASQMAEAVYDSVQVEIGADDCVFRASGRTVRFAGYTAAYTDVKSDDDDDDESKKLFPPMKEGDVLALDSLVKEQKFTQPPKRYTDASLVHTMDEKGIGRPSTYASIISALSKRGYVKKEGKSMIPTDIAYKMTDLLTKYFDDIMDINFTAKLEKDLDEIENGGTDWKDILRSFYPDFEKRLKNASTDGDELTDILCEKCGQPMIRREGKYGKYLACSGFPACRNIVSEEKEVYSETRCPRCGSVMAERNGRYGRFLLCTKEGCGQSLPIDAEIMSGEKCPDCGGVLVRKMGKYGKYTECIDCKKKTPVRDENGGNVSESGEKGSGITEGTCPECGRPMRHMRSKKGKPYLSCTGYPECKFMSWDVPTGEKCPKCGAYLVLRGGKVCCSEKTCSFRQGVETQ